MNKQKIEKAIRVLKCQINDLTSTLIEESQYPFRSSIERQIESLEIAISALEQQLTGGWIPDIMKEVLGEEATDIILSNPDEFKKWLKRGIWNCKRLNELSNCKNVWIPVSERLPDKTGYYLVTYHEWTDGNYLPKYDDTRVKILRYQEAVFRLPVCCDKKAEQDIGREVLAWRELPEIWRNNDELVTDNNVVTKSGKDNKK